MMTGRITPFREAIMALRVRGPGGQEAAITAVLDTGFTDYLSLSPGEIAALALPRRGAMRVALADGSIVSLQVYVATVLWDGQWQRVECLAADGGPLAGMGLLYGFRATLDVVDGGQVKIEALP
jgi:predicted aspartyl protease